MINHYRNKYTGNKSNLLTGPGKHKAPLPSESSFTIRTLTSPVIYYISCNVIQFCVLFCLFVCFLFFHLFFFACSQCTFHFVLIILIMICFNNIKNKGKSSSKFKTTQTETNNLFLQSPSYTLNVMTPPNNYKVFLAIKDVYKSFMF